MFGGVYKLAAVEDENGAIIPKIKVSENVEKSQSLTSRKYTASTAGIPARLLPTI